MKFYLSTFDRQGYSHSTPQQVKKVRIEEGHPSIKYYDTIEEARTALKLVKGK